MKRVPGAGRGSSSVLVAVVDGLKGFPHPITAVFRRPRFRRALSICSDTAWKDVSMRSAPQGVGYFGGVSGGPCPAARSSAMIWRRLSMPS